MKQQFTDEKTGISYRLQGDYYLPDLMLTGEEENAIGAWGQRHLQFIREHKRVLYTNLLTCGEVHSYLAVLNEQAENMFSRLVEQMAAQEGITETLKVVDQMAWVQQMNNIRNCAAEVVNRDLIFSY